MTSVGAKALVALCVSSLYKHFFVGEIICGKRVSSSINTASMQLNGKHHNDIIIIL